MVASTHPKSAPKESMLTPAKLTQVDSVEIAAPLAAVIQQVLDGQGAMMAKTMQLETKLEATDRKLEKVLMNLEHLMRSHISTTSPPRMPDEFP